MNIGQLKQLISKGESNHLEFKKSTSQLKAAFETICAFLNNKGGIVLLGVKDNGQIIGQNVTDNTKQELAREIKKIEPNAPIEIYYIPLDDGNQVIALEVPPGKHIPYAYDGRPFERNQSTTERMTQHLYEQLIIKRGQLNHDWDEYLTSDYSIDDLDHEEIRKTIKEGVDHDRISVKALNDSLKQILSNLKLLEHDALNNAAVALYAKNPKSNFTEYTISLARFKGVDKLGDFIDNKRVTGNIFQLISAAHEFASRHLPIASYFEADKLQRIDQPAVPVLALREALINAMCHRDYTIRNTTFTLAIYDDRLELWNVGGLLPPLNIEALQHPHGSYPRNKLIADVLYKRGWIESWGSGTLRMIDYCSNNKTPAPIFSEYSGGFSVTFPFKEKMGHYPQGEPKTEINLTIRQEKILSILADGSILSANQIFSYLQDNSSLRTIQADLTELKKLGVIKQIGKGLQSKWALNK
jgi:ATP-dependent DNA helicase RecG